MKSEEIEGVLKLLKTSLDKRLILKCLSKLRSDVVKDSEGIRLFRSLNGVVPIIRFLNKPNEKILEAALSILANCCTDKESCKQVLENKISIHLTAILTSLANPLIQSRACRLLGNLAKCSVHPDFVASAVSITRALHRIIENSNEETIQYLAVRACGFLFTDDEFLKAFMLIGGFHLLLTKLANMTKCTEVEATTQPAMDVEPSLLNSLKMNSPQRQFFGNVFSKMESVRSDIYDEVVLENTARAWTSYALPKNRSGLELANEILKCMLSFSLRRIPLKGWKAFDSSNLFEPIAFYASENCKQRSLALKILSNLSRNGSNHENLCRERAGEVALELLSQSKITDIEKRYCLDIIVNLSGSACERAKIRHSGQLSRLFSIVKNSHSKREKSLIILMLSNFIFDNVSMEFLNKAGLVPVLINELDIYLTSDDPYYKKCRDKRLQRAQKRKLKMTSDQTVKRLKTLEILDICMDSPSSSPRSRASDCSPCSSRSISPISMRSLSAPFGGADDNNYSPACSDVDASDDEDDNMNVLREDADESAENTNIIKLLDACSDVQMDDNNIPLCEKVGEEENSTDKTSVEVPELEHDVSTTIDKIENLFYRCTLILKKSPDLCSVNTINTLLKSIHTFGSKTSFANSLTHILMDGFFFTQIISQGVPHKLYKLTEIKTLRSYGHRSLSTLTSVGESNYGRQVLVGLLRSTANATRKQAIVAAVYIIRDIRFLYGLLEHEKVLPALFEMLESTSDAALAVNAADASTAMACYSLNISLPKVDKHAEFVCEPFEAEICFRAHANCDMRFAVVNDDVSSPTVFVGFNKQLLCDSSDVFKCMLNGNFREAKENEVQLKNYSVKGVRYFLNLLTLTAENSTYNVPNEFNALLEAFEMSRIYLMPAMEAVLEKLLLQRLDADGCLILFEWSLENHHTELAQSSINYWLAAPISAEAKIKILQRAKSATFGETFTDGIKHTILERCRKALV